MSLESRDKALMAAIIALRAVNMARLEDNPEAQPIPVDLPADASEELLKAATGSGFVVRADLGQGEHAV
jgi:hypothetical protein